MGGGRGEEAGVQGLAETGVRRRGAGVGMAALFLLATERCNVLHPPQSSFLGIFFIRLILSS